MSESKDPHAGRLRLGRQSAAGETYFVTKCVEDRRLLLADAQAAEVVIGSLAHVRQQNRIKLLAFVVMPDHYHAVFSLLPGEDLSHLMRRIGSFTANRIRQLLRLPHGVWQGEGFYDHRCRDEADVLDCVEYVQHNPVRKELVARAEDWLFSSAHPTRNGLLDWDWFQGQ